MGAVEVIVTLIAGGIVVWSIVKRYQTINSFELVDNTRLTIFVFSAFVIGLLLSDPKKLTDVSYIMNIEWVKIFFVVSPFFIPTIYRLIKGYTFFNAIDFRYFRYFELAISKIFNGIDFLLSVPVLLCIVLYFYSDIERFVFHILDEIFKNFGFLFAILLFLSFSIFLGFIHSVFGTIIAAVNIAMIFDHFLLDGTFGGGLGTVFDVFEIIGISSMPLKWAIIIVSTFLGIHSAMSLDDMKDVLQNGLF